MNEIFDKDNELISDYLGLLYLHKKDYPNSMKMLSNPENHGMGDAFDSWFESYDKRSSQEETKPNKRRILMDSVNPKYVLRNYLAEVAIRKAEDLRDYDEVGILFDLLRSPFDEHKGFESYTNKAPEWAKNLEVSCSS